MGFSSCPLCPPRNAAAPEGSVPQGAGYFLEMAQSWMLASHKPEVLSALGSKPLPKALGTLKPKPSKTQSLLSNADSPRGGFSGAGSKLEISAASEFPSLEAAGGRALLGRARSDTMCPK